MLSTRRPAAWRGLSTGRWPSLCAVCHGWGAGRVCADCAWRFALVVPRCRRCALPLPAARAVCGACIAAPPDFDAAAARVDYRVLKQAGATRVEVWVVARTPRPEDA
jgi:predicted amidophosphoribosyltransferase